MAAGVFLSACNEESKVVKAELNFEDSDVKVAYVIGAGAGKTMAKNLATLDGTDITIDKEVLIQAFADGINDQSKLDDEAMQASMTEFRARVNSAMEIKKKAEAEVKAKEAEENKLTGAAFLEENKAKEGVVTLESGLQYMVIKEGNGNMPAKADRVKVHYTGTLIDGTQFDSSAEGAPRTFGVTQVIKGWSEALQLMKEGSKWQLVIPSGLAYGSQGRPSIPGNSVLLFDVEMIEIVKPEPKKPAATTAPAPAKK